MVILTFALVPSPAGADDRGRPGEWCGWSSALRNQRCASQDGQIQVGNIPESQGSTNRWVNINNLSSIINYIIKRKEKWINKVKRPSGQLRGDRTQAPSPSRWLRGSTAEWRGKLQSQHVWFNTEWRPQGTCFQRQAARRPLSSVGGSHLARGPYPGHACFKWTLI